MTLCYIMNGDTQVNFDYCGIDTGGFGFRGDYSDCDERDKFLLTLLVELTK